MTSKYSVIITKSIFDTKTIERKIISLLKKTTKKILLFNTALNEYDVQKLHKRIEAIAGKNFDNLEVYYLREDEPKERLELIDYVIKTTENLGYVFIDGIRDLSYKFNDITHTHQIIKWIDNRNIHLITTVCENQKEMYEYLLSKKSSEY